MSYRIIEKYAARFRDLYIITNMSDSHLKLNFKWTSEEIKIWSEKLN